MRSGLWSVSKKPTARSGAGFSRSLDETEPNIRTLQRQLQDLVSDFPGIFLSKSRNAGGGLDCPSIKVFESSEFMTGSDFSKWFREKTDFLRFLELWPFLSILKDLVFGSQRTRIGNLDISGGLTIVRLTKTDGGGSFEQGYPTDIITFFREYVVPFLLCLYWSRFMIEISIPDWERKIDGLNEKFQSLRTTEKPKVEKFLGLYNETVDLGNRFETFALDEIKKQREMQRSRFLKSSNMPSSRSLSEGTLSLDILADLTTGVQFVTEEANMLSNLRRKVRSLTAQYRNYSEFALQRDMRLLNKRALVVSLVSLGVASLAVILTIILHFH